MLFSHSLLIVAVSSMIVLFTHAAAQHRTYCNPLNIDYAYCAIPDFVELGKHRTSADPVIVLFKGTYFLFATNQYGYWWSNDLAEWHFSPRRFLKPYHDVYDELCAPAAVRVVDTLLLIGSTHTTDDPQKLYNTIMVYSRNEYYFKAMDVGTTYYFQIEAFNRNGIGKRSSLVRVE